MREFCWEEIPGAPNNCLLMKGHANGHSAKGEAEPPEEEWFIRILKTSMESKGFLWSSLWTCCDPRWMRWMVDNGYLTEIVGRGGYRYAGGSYYMDAPANEITDKGRNAVREKDPYFSLVMEIDRTLDLPRNLSFAQVASALSVAAARWARISMDNDGPVKKYFPNQDAREQVQAQRP